VYSTVVRLVPAPRLDELQVEEADFINFLKLSFSQKRKTLANNLKSRWASDDLARALGKAKIKPSVRAEALSLEASANVFRELTSGRPSAVA
jgi:16S rRNA (adenine1518-N6/adenine1519-N6)-dimethyltransferase